MTTKEEQDILTRVGPGTPMGNLMRQYWVPAGLSSEFPEPDGDPVRIRLLGEDLIGYRTTSGRMGLIQNACPHRGASMFFGRNEEEGIRCVYHGWKFDVEGHCVDMPSEPELTQAKEYVRFTSYPCVERGGLVWTYMGPRETPPPMPELEANMIEGARVISVLGAECNWLQTMENNMDTLHAGFLHWGAVSPESSREEWADFPQVFDQVSYRCATFHTIERESGASYACERPTYGDEENSVNWRIMNWHFPFFTQSPTATFGQCGGLVAVVPVDDTYTISYSMGLGRKDWDSKDNTKSSMPGMGASAVLPNTTDWLGRFQPAVRLEDDLQIDRQVQRFEKGTTRGYTGIEVVQDQDRGITESQGLIQDLTIQNLRTTDRMIHMVRVRLLDAAKALRDHGTVPPGVDNPHIYRHRSGHLNLPKDADVWEATKELREEFMHEEGNFASSK